MQVGLLSHEISTCYGEREIRGRTRFPSGEGSHGIGIRQQITQMARSSPSRFCVDYIMIIAEVPEFVHTSEEMTA